MWLFNSATTTRSPSSPNARYLPLPLEETAARQEQGHAEDDHGYFKYRSTSPPVPTPSRRPLRWHLFVGLASVLQLAVLALAAFGLYGAILHALGRVKILTLTLEQVRDAGWVRPQLELAPPMGQEAATAAAGVLHTYDMASPNTTLPTTSQHLLILTPLSNCARNIDSLFGHLDRLTHPRSNTSLGFLVSDTSDDTGLVLRKAVDARLNDYRAVTLVQKDYQLDLPSHSGRHSLWAQGGRRGVMAKARTTLLMSTLRADVDWVLWLDSDVAELSPTLFEDLLYYGGAGVGAAATDSIDEPLADVVTPNIFRRRRRGAVQGYDQNNWAETPESRRRIAKLDPDQLLVEGSRLLDQRRSHLVDARVAPNVTLESDLIGSAFPEYRAAGWQSTNLYDPASDAYIGRRMELDAVGGVATLVRAETHRLGAVFPSWLENHEIETEGFGVMAKKVGARIVGLPNYVVLHAMD